MFEALSRYPREAYAQGEIVLTNVVDARLWILGIAIVTAFIIAGVVFGARTKIYRAWQKALIATLQVAVVAGVIGLVAGPHLRTSKIQPGANTIAVLMDTSQSMEFAADGNEGQQRQDGVTNRYDAARSVVEGTLSEALEDIAEVSYFTVADVASRVDGFAQNPNFVPSTRLVKSIDMVLQSFRGAPLASVIVLSDGADNDEAGLAVAALANFGVPVHTVGFGPLELPGETVLMDVRMPADAPPHSLVTAEFILEHASAGAALVQVRDRGTLLAQREIELDPTTSIIRSDISFASGDAGIRELSFSVVPPETDQLEENNFVDRLLTVSQRQRRVLYLEGEPRWEYKFIRRALQGDDVVKLASWLRTTDRKTYRQGVETGAQLATGFPVDKASLYAYDLIILGSIAATLLDDEQHAWLETFVSERGGSLLALAGREALGDGGWDVRPLARALPATLQRQAGPTYQETVGKVGITRDGYASSLLVAQGEGAPGLLSLPELRDIQILGASKPAASTLLELTTPTGVRPLLITQPYGLGTTAILATATTWRWQMSTPLGDERHSLFWRHLTRQLAESAPRAKSVDLIANGDRVEIRAWVRDEEFAPLPTSVANAKITRPDRSEVDILLTPSEIPGLHVGAFTPSEQGVSRVDVAIDGETRNTITRFMQFGASNSEFVDPVRNEGLLRRISEVSGGMYWQPDDVDALREQLSFSGAGIRTIELLPLWNLPIFFFLVLMLKLCEWGLRRFWGGV
jgi:hypothetical protein